MKTITNKEAFAPVENEKNIPLDFSKHNFQFTRNWFRNRNQRTWASFILPRFQKIRPLKVIQIGIFEGYDLCWLLEHVLRHKKSSVLAIDPWLATTKLNQEQMDACFERAKHNLSPWKDKVQIVRGLSQDVLSECRGDGTYDLAVIDGDHNSEPVLRDAINCLRLLKPGGLLVFDDVRNKSPKKDHVIDGLRKFLEIHEKDVKLVFQHRYCDGFEKI